MNQAEFLVLFSNFLRQIARYLPHQVEKYTSKKHLKPLDDKIKTVSK